MTIDPTDLCYAGAAEQARLIRAGQVSACELIAATLDRIEAVNPVLNAYRVVLADQATTAAARHDERTADRQQLPLLGVPVAVKDSEDVAGEVTTFGTSANRRAATVDSPIVSALRAAGAIIIGKTTCSELMAWPFTETPAWGATRNPWNVDYSPGGSSGGAAAAAAAGLCGLALGSDGLGSIRAPAGFTGLFGLKPQRGRLWHSPVDWNRLVVNGPLCRTVADAALFLDATAGDLPVGGFSAAITGGFKPLRIAVAWKSLAKFPVTARLGDDQRRAVEETADLLTGLGHTVIQREIKFPLKTSTNVLVRYLAGVAEGEATLDAPDALSRRTRKIARYGRLISDRRLQGALAAEVSIARGINRIFDDVDVVLTPGAIQAPLRIGELEGKGAWRSFDASGRMIPHYGPWNVIGQPAASIPAGFDRTGLPLSIQLAGRPHDEATLLSLAAQIESARPWSSARPALAPIDQ